MFGDDVIVADKKKTKKQLILERNKRNQRIFRASAEQIEIADDVREKDEELREHIRRAPKTGDDEPVWSAKVQEIRNRISGKRRGSLERWNRFSGTGDEGGRGL